MAADLAQPKVTCNQVIAACDKALAKKDEQIKVSDLAITKLQSENTDLDKKVKQKDAALGNLWHNPIFMFVVGVLGGVVIATRLK